MKKKSVIEADLDPTGSRHTRPGAKAAEVAIRDSKLAEKRLKKITSTSSRGCGRNSRKASCRRETQARPLAARL